jgi:hypothetical protein
MGVQHPDSGASLILAIGFVLMVSLMVGGLVSLATTGLNNRGSLQLVRDRQYAADAGITQAIADTRALAPASCTVGTGSNIYQTAPIPNNVAIRVDWDNACATNTVKSSDGTFFPQRNVVFSACVNPATNVRCDAADVIIRAQVNFEPASGAVTKTYVQSWSVNR